jgi:hypothetical protein
MSKQTIELVTPSTIVWENLEGFVRDNVQQFIPNTWGGNGLKSEGGVDWEVCLNSLQTFI